MLVKSKPIDKAVSVIRWVSVIRKVIVGLCFFVPVSFAADTSWQASTSAAAETNPIRYDVESVTQGKLLFAQHCQACHGYWGEGDGVVGLSLANRPANLLRIAGKQTVGEFAWKIAEGRNVMPAFREVLSQEDIWHVVNFIESLENELGSEDQSIVVRRCVMCHGLAGEAFYEEWPDLPQMSQQEIENKLFAHRSGVIADSTMAKVTFDLTDEEIKQAAEYYSSLNIDVQNRDVETDSGSPIDDQ